MLPSMLIQKEATSKTNPIISLAKILLIALVFGGASASYGQCTPVGDQTSYGAGSWIGYVYSSINTTNPPTNAFTTTYHGYLTQPEIFNQDVGTGAISGANLCGTYSDQFAIRFKMQKTFAPGYYSFQVGGDDGYRLSFDGGVTFPINNWNDHSYTYTTASIYVSGVTNMVLEYYEQGGYSRISYSYGMCSNPSTDATSISGTTTICAGTSTTLTATGGTAALGAIYQWGTGTTVGSNIIAGQNSASITVAPTTTTTYWVNRIDPAPCTFATAGITQTVTVNAISTAPTYTSGTTTICLGNSTTLTANGGTLASGSVYEWGTGTTVGINTIAGQTASSITVSPSTTTTYWVRRDDASPCTNITSGITTAVTVNIPAGDQVSYGNGSWIGYVYSGLDTVNPPSNVFTATYRGYITQTEQFNQDLGYGAISGANLCGTYTDQFSTRFKMQENFTAGYYTFTVGGDDGYRLSLDGGTTYIINKFFDQSYTSTASAQVYLSGPTNLVLEYYEQGGVSRVSFSYIACTTFSTAPTAISGTTSLCNLAGGTTLTATGGYEAPGATYQWGTGSTVGSNIIAGATTSSYYINPSSTTTYWVRRVDGAPCNLTTSGVTQTITVAIPSTMPTTISGTTTICSGTSTTLTASGGTMGSGAVYQWGSGYTEGVNIIAGATGSSITVNPTTMTGYWVTRVDSMPCNTIIGQITTTVNVTAVSTAVTSITGAGSGICSGSSVTLTATGGTSATGGVYQWGTGTTLGSNVIAGQTGATLTVSPTATTTYWVRRYDSGCASYSGGVTQQVTVSPTTVAGTLSSASSTICKGRTPSPIILAGNTGNVIKWQYANDAAFTSGVTDITSTVTTLTSAQIGALTTTRYFRAVVQSGSCGIANTAVLGITVPTAVTYNGSWTATPNATTPVIISSNYTLPNDLNVCSCQVMGTAIVTVPTGITLTVQREITIATSANMVIQDQGSVVQVDNDATDTGSITFNRKTTPLKQYDYTYWSSPLAGQTLSQFGTPSLYYSFNPNINNWAAEAATNVMIAAKGYIVRVPNNLNFSTSQVVQTTINGAPNNGIINASIVKGTGTTYNLIGNPYPSAIDIDQFLLDPTNSTIVNGTIYLWTHNTAISNTIPGTAIYNYTKDDYAKYNITGGVKTGSTAITGGVTPNGKIASGQGFFIEANSALANGSYQASFSNSMRIAGNNNQFFKTNNAVVLASNQNTMSSSIEKHRVWLNISNTGGAYDETLVGYIQGATNGIDSLFDGNTMPAGNVVSLYSVLGTNNLAIQGRALPFNDSDIVPIGYSTTLTGDFTIALENFDGLFNNQNIYLLDKTTNTYYDLKAQNVTFNSASGTFNDRFELHYTSTLLSNHQTDFTSNDVQIIKKDKHIAVKATNASIGTVQVFDILGKTIYTVNKINSTDFISTDFNIAPQILLVKVTLDNNETITKKVLMN